MAADLGDRRVVGFQVFDQIPQRLILLWREMLGEGISGGRSMPTEQADANRAGVVPLRVRPDDLQWPTRYNRAIPVDQEVIPDVGPSAVLNVPAPNLGHLLRRRAVRPPIRASRRAVDNDLVQRAHLIHPQS